MKERRKADGSGRKRKGAKGVKEGQKKDNMIQSGTDRSKEIVKKVIEANHFVF